MLGSGPDRRVCPKPAPAEGTESTFEEKVRRPAQGLGGRSNGAFSLQMVGHELLGEAGDRQHSCAGMKVKLASSP
jgi:hypothetical protein